MDQLRPSSRCRSRWILVSLFLLFSCNLSLTTTIVVAALQDSSLNANDDSCNNENGSAGESCPAMKQQQPSRTSRDDGIIMYHFESTTSTQDAAKEIILQQDEKKEESEIVNMMIVTAREQTNGRGTSGRKWMGRPGNTFVTICIRQEMWLDKTNGLSMTLMPLKMGTIMAQRIQEKLVLQQQTSSSTPPTAPPKVTIKWPNDVLVNEKKISGVLIESTSDWFLIGIGVNVAFAPIVPTSGPNKGRPSTSISEYYHNNNNNNDEEYYVAMAQTLGQDMGKDLQDWLDSCKKKHQKTNLKELLNSWRGWVDWEKELILRDGDDKTSPAVVPVTVENDGRLLVRDVKTGKERHVVADYFL